MSFFGGLFKGVAKIASAVGGAVLKQTPVGAALGAVKSAVGSLKKARIAPAVVYPTMQQEALEAKRGRTTIRNAISTTAMKARSGKRRRRRRVIDAIGFMTPQLSRVRTTYAPVARKAKTVTKRTSSGVKRQPPKGGLDLKAMAAAWRAAGKPGTWLGWIKSNPIKS